jgi:hypothetical protein
MTAALRDSAIATLVLHARYTNALSYYDDWLDAFLTCPEFRATEIDIAAPRADEKLRLALPEAEVVVLLHSTNGDSTALLEPLVPALQDRRGTLLSFVGNEVNLPGTPISGKRDILRRLGVDVVATQLLGEAGEFLFGDIARVMSVPHALNSTVFTSTHGDRDRSLDIGVRSAAYSPHLGDDDRNRLFATVRASARRHHLRVDVSAERLDRRAWARYLNNCRGTVANEAGSWYLSRDDDWIEEIRDYIAERDRGVVIPAGRLAFQGLRSRIPVGTKRWLARQLKHFGLRFESYAAADIPFAEIYQLFFAGRPRAPVYSKCISSRHFDAAGTGTCQILMTGRYNDILVANEHYIPVRDDLSDIDEALRRFSDPEERQGIARRAREHVLANHTYRHRVREIYNQLSASRVQ